MSGATRGSLQEMRETEFVQENRELLNQLAYRLGELIGNQDRQGLLLMGIALQSLTKQAFTKYQELHGQTDQADQGSKPN